MMLSTHPYLRGVAPGEPFDLTTYSAMVAFMNGRFLREQRDAAVQRALRCQARLAGNEVPPVDRRAHPTQRARVLAAIGDHPIHLRQVVRATGLSITSVRNMVYILVKQGAVERVGWGAYRKVYS